MMVGITKESSCSASRKNIVHELISRGRSRQTNIMMYLESKVKNFDNELKYTSFLLARLHFTFAPLSSSEASSSSLPLAGYFFNYKNHSCFQGCWLQILVNMCKDEKLFQGPSLMLHMHCWWCASPPSQVKLPLKLSASPCLAFYCLALFETSDMSLVWNFWYVILLVEAEDRWKSAEISLCPSGLSSGVTGGALLGGLKQAPLGAVAVWLPDANKKDFASAFLPGQFCASWPCFEFSDVPAATLTAGLGWYFQKQKHQNSWRIKTRKQLFYFGKKKSSEHSNFPI